MELVSGATLLPSSELRNRIQWLIKLRWIASFGLISAITCIHYFFHIELPLLELYLGSAALVLLNGIYNLGHRKLQYKERDSQVSKKVKAFVNIQICLDLILLAYLLHYTGGIENPFILFFVFHMVIASILLSNKAAYLQATFASVICGIIAIGEYVGFISHHHLAGFIKEELIRESYYFLGKLFVLISTLHITVYMTTSIVNKLREREEELRESNKKLELANQKLAEADRVKSKYVLTVSHDIQATLSAIYSCLIVVREGFVGSVSSGADDMITRAEQRTEGLLDFVKGLFYLSALRTKTEIITEQVSVKKAIDDASQLIGGKVKEKQLTLNIAGTSLNAIVLTDSDAMKWLLRVLLDNAVIYSPVGEEITINVCKAQSPGMVEFRLSNVGARINDEDIPYVFDDFYRGAVGEKVYPTGNGLGLAIAKEIVEYYSGKIRLETAGCLNSFIFTLPRVSNS